MLTATAVTPLAGTPPAPVTGRSRMPRAGWAPIRLPGPTGEIVRVSRIRVGVKPWYWEGVLGGAGAGTAGSVSLPSPDALSGPGTAMSFVRWRTSAASGSPGIARLAPSSSAANPAAAGAAADVPAKHGP